LGEGLARESYGINMDETTTWMMRLTEVVDRFDRVEEVEDQFG